MTNINNIVLESLGNHFKKHWKKYALGIGAAGLAGLGAGGAHVQNTAKKQLKLIKIGTGLGAAGLAAHQIYHYKKAKNVINRVDKAANRLNEIRKKKQTQIDNDYSSMRNTLRDEFLNNRLSNPDYQTAISDLDKQAEGRIRFKNSQHSRNMNKLNDIIQDAQKHSLYHRLFKSYHVKTS